MKDDKFAVFLGFLTISALSLVAGVFVGGLMTYGRVVDEATKPATIFCVEKPKECKIRYDYYKLEEKTNERPN